MVCDTDCYTNERPYEQYKAQLLHRAQTQNNIFNRDKISLTSNERDRSIINTKTTDANQMALNYLLSSTILNNNSSNQKLPLTTL